MKPETPESLWTSIPDVAYNKTPDSIIESEDRRELSCIIAKRALLSAYGDPYKNADPETHIADLLADLRHLCDKIGADFADLNERAYRHYAGEI